MRVIEIISSGGMYGAEAVILNLARVLNQNSHTVSLAVFANSAKPNTSVHEHALREGIESHLIPCRGQVDVQAVQAIKSQVARIGPDLVHAHGYKADIYACLALRGSRLPLVSSCHGWLSHGPKTSLYGMLDRFVLRRFQRVITVSENVRLQVVQSGVKPQKVSIIANGINLSPFDRAPATLKRELRWDANPVVGLVGRLSAEKCIPDFVRACTRVIQQVPAARFFVVGDGPDRTAIEAQISRSGIAGQFRLVGRREDMPGVYASADLLVCASRQEGLPMVVLEGMASARPFVATPVGEIPRLVRHGQTGLLVPVGDVERMATAIVRLISDPGLRLSLGAAARVLIETQYSAERMAADYVRVFEDAVAEAAEHRLRLAPGTPAIGGRLQ